MWGPHLDFSLSPRKEAIEAQGWVALVGVDCQVGGRGGGPHILSAQLFQCSHHFSWTVWHNFSVSASRGKPHVMILELVMPNIWHSQHDVCVFGIWGAPEIVNIELWTVTRPARLQVLLWQNAWWPKWWAKHGKKFGKIGVLRPALHNAWDGLRSKWVLQKIYPATVGNYQMQFFLAPALFCWSNNSLEMGPHKDLPP